MSVEIRLGRDEVTGALSELASKLDTGRRYQLMKVLGVRGEQELRSWFAKRDSDSANKNGWPRQHFWARIARATAFDPSKTSDEKATIVVSDPALAAKIYGANIRPTGAISPSTGKPTRAIAIPLQAAVYGKRPSSNPIQGMFVIWRKGGDRGFLATREGGELILWYRLVPEVTVPKDPRALPPMEQLGGALVQEAEAWFRRTSSQGDN